MEEKLMAWNQRVKSLILRSENFVFILYRKFNQNVFLGSGMLDSLKSK